MVIGDIIVNNARLFPNKIGIVDAQDSRRFAWSEVNDRVNRLSNGMLDLGLKKGDRVGLISENSAECGEFQFAVAKVGAIGCPFNYRLNELQLKNIINNSGARLLFVQDKYCSKIRNILANLVYIEHCIGIGGQIGFPIDYEKLIDMHSNEEPKVDVEENDLVNITYSSGTTGLPKGVMVTHKNRINYCIGSCLFTERYSLDDVALVSAPFCGGTAGQVQFIGPAFAGSTIVMYVLKGSTWAEVVEKERVTVMLTTRARMMPVWDYLKTCNKRYNLSSLKRVTTGAQVTPPEHLKEIMDFCGVSESAKELGITETSATGPRLLAHEIRAGFREGATEKEKKRLESVGKPILDMKMKIVDDNCEEVPKGVLGEILLSGDSVSPGYWKDEEMTKERFRDGWYHTNDLGVLDEDGYLYLKGRRDYMIKTGGFLVSPAEIEEVLTRHPSVSEAVVIGIGHYRWGEAVKAIVCLKSESKVDEEELRNHCRDYLGGFQIPKYFEFVESMPKDGAGRIVLKAVKDQYGKGI